MCQQREPALRYLFLRPRGNWKVVAQFSYRLVDFPALQENMYKDQPARRILASRLSQGIHRFLRIVLLCREGLAQQVQ